MYEGSLFSKFFPTVVICRLLDDSCYSDRCEVIPFCGSGVHFSNSQRCWASFHIAVSHLYDFFGKNVYSVLLPIFWLDCFLILSYKSFLGILDINPLLVIFANTFPFCRLSFCFGRFPLLCKNFLLWCSSTCLFLLLLGSDFKKSSRPVSRSLTPTLTSRSLWFQVLHSSLQPILS